MESFKEYLNENKAKVTFKNRGGVGWRVYIDGVPTEEYIHRSYDGGWKCGGQHSQYIKEIKANIIAHVEEMDIKAGTEYLGMP